MHKISRAGGLAFFAILISIIIFIIDINIPLGVAGGVPHVAVILITARGSNRLTILMACLTSVLVLLGLYFSPSGGELWQVIANRFLTLSIIWVSTALLFQYKKTGHGLKIAVESNQLLVFEINERRATEDQLRRLVRSVEAVGEAIVMADPDGIIQYVNPAFTSITGYTAAEAIGQTPRMLKSGLTKPKEYADLWSTILNGGKWSGVLINMKKNGTFYEARNSITPVYKPTGELEGFISIQEDVTERRRLEKDLLRAQKLESLGTLAGGLAHDFNNFLTGIMLNISTVKSLSDQTAETKNLLTSAEVAILRARGITQQLLTFAEGGALIKSDMFIQPLIKDAVEFALHGTSIVYEVDTPEDLWPVSIDEGQVNQLINNLVLNALHAMPEGGRLVVSGKNIIHKKNDIIRPLKPGQYVEIAVKDDGVGMPSEIVGSIFDPYFTTKEDGSGLGLFSVYQIVERHGGNITVDSVEGEGSTFTFYLPAAEKNIMLHHYDTLINGSGRVLVMDDEEMICRGIKKTLELLGYNVVTTLDGEEAVRVYKEHLESGKRFDATILDLIIPGGVNGKEAIRLLRGVDPEIVAIVSSGYANDPIMANYETYGFKAAIPKPYTDTELSKVLSDVMAQHITA